MRRAVFGCLGLAAARLIDAHTFCWLLEKLEDIGVEGKSPRKDAGRVVGGRDRSLLEMRASIENTARNSNGQIVVRTTKNKDLGLSTDDLDKFLRSRMDMQQDRCALTGIPFHFHGPDANKNLMPSPDRIDSNGHYEADNIQIVCRFVNQWKGASYNEEFSQLLALVRDVGLDR